MGSQSGPRWVNARARTWPCVSGLRAKSGQGVKEGNWQGPARGHSVVLSGLSGWKQNLPALPSGWRCGPEPTTLPFHLEIYIPRDNRLALVTTFPFAFLWVRKLWSKQWAECCGKLLCWHVIWKSFSLSHLLNTWCFESLIYFLSLLPPRERIKEHWPISIIYSLSCSQCLHLWHQQWVYVAIGRRAELGSGIWPAPMPSVIQISICGWQS